MSESRAGFSSPSTVATVTVADMADARDAGYDDGFKQGYSEGHAQGLQSGQAELQQQMELELTKIRQLIQAMQTPFQGFRDELVQELKLISTQICDTFLHHKVGSDQALLEHLVDEAVQKLLPSDHQVVIHVNNHNKDVVEKALVSHVEEGAWRLQVNDKLSDGNVFLESGHSRIKIELNTLLESYIASLGH